MATDHFTATLAFPRLFLAIKKLFNSVPFDEIQILYHAHSVARPVSTVDSFQPFARKTATLKTKTYFVVCQFGTSFFQKGTFFVSWSATRAIRHFDAFVFDVIFAG